MNCSLSHINDIIRTLEKKYPTLPLKELTGKHPFKTLVTTILSQRAKDEMTMIVARNLFEHVSPTPEAFQKILQQELEELIFSSGFYQAKAKNIKDLSTILINRYKGQVPATLEDLISLPGVGRKTANIVLSHCFDISVIAVDIHVFRITHRLGWVKAMTPEKTEKELMNVLPKKHWSAMNHVMVRLGQDVCKSQKPRCDQCSIQQWCETGQRNVSSK